MVHLVDLETSEALPLLEDGILADLKHSRVVDRVLEQLVVASLGTAGLEKIHIFRLAAFVETLCQYFGKGFDVVVVESVGRH